MSQIICIYKDKFPNENDKYLEQINNNEEKQRWGEFSIAKVKVSV